MIFKKKGLERIIISLMIASTIGLAACQPSTSTPDSTATPIPVGISTSTPTQMNEPTPTPTVEPTTSQEIIEMDPVTDDEAKAILQELLPRAAVMYGSTFNGASYKVDETKLMPGDENYALVVEGPYSSLADLKEDVESIFTQVLAEDRFYSRYLDEDDGISLPLYKEHEGQLYLNRFNGGRGWAIEWLIETSVVQSQEGNRVYIEMETILFNEPYEPLTVVLESIDGQWRIADHLD